MNRFVTGILFTGLLAMGASTLLAAQTAASTSNNWSEQWFRAKYGRPSPLEESRLKAEQANTAYREVTPRSVVMPFDNGAEQRYRAKYGRPSPLEEARVKAQTP